MTPDIRVRIHRFQRSPAETTKAFLAFPASVVTDAIGRRGALSGIQPIGSGPTEFCGSALTVWTVPGDNLGPWVAVSMAKPGDVVIIANGGAKDASVFGDLAFGMARNAGVAAIVTDGLVRDADGIGRVGLPVFAAGLSPNSPFKHGPAIVGAPISIAGTVVQSGDIVRGDRDGVVIVPRSRCVDALAECRAITRKEEDVQRQIDAGATQPAWLAEVLAQHVEWIDGGDVG